jgi:hypothetical protein
MSVAGGRVFIMDEGFELLTQAVALLRRVARLPLSLGSDEDLCAFTAQTETAGRLVDSLRVQAAGEVDERSRVELGSAGLAYRQGHRRSVHFVEQITRVSQAEAARRISLGAAVRPRSSFDGYTLPAHHPEVAAALANGTMGIDAAAQVVRCLDQAARHSLEVALFQEAEASLVALAATDSADQVAIWARVWRERLDPDGSEPRESQLRERRGLWLGRERQGLVPFWGSCDPASSALLRAVFSESANPGNEPRFLGDDDRERAADAVATADGNLVWRPSDPRTREQRQLDVLLGLVTAGTRATGLEPGGMRSMTTVMATVRLEDLESGRGIGWLDDVAEPIAAATIRELACDAGHRKVLLGNAGEILYFGRLQRLFTAAQRRALAVRDGGCVWPNCQAPPSWCHAHHVEEFNSNGKRGPTDIDNGVLLCPAHHHMLHNSAHSLKMVDGRPHLLAPPWLDPEQEWRPLGRSRVTMAA